MQGTVIRAARVEDAAQIAAVHVRSWQSAYRGLLPQAYLDGLDHSNVRARRFYEAVGWLADGALKSDESRGFPMTEVRYHKSLSVAG